MLSDKGTNIFSEIGKFLLFFSWRILHTFLCENKSPIFLAERAAFRETMRRKRSAWKKK